MNALNLAKSVYSKPESSTKSIVEIEYDTISRVTRVLADGSVNQKSNFAKLVNAVHQNRRLWTIFALDAANDKNILPKDTRVGILNLAGFVFSHSSAVLRGDESTTALADINVAIMKGLRKGGEANERANS